MGHIEDSADGPECKTWDEARLYVRQCTDAQVRGVLEKESERRGELYHAAREELARRGLE